MREGRALGGVGYAGLNPENRQNLLHLPEPGRNGVGECDGSGVKDLGSVFSRNPLDAVF